MKLITNIFSSQSLTKLILNSKINRCKKVSIESTIYVYSNVIGFVYCLLYHFYAFLQYLIELTNCISEYNERYRKTSSTGIPMRSEINRLTDVFYPTNTLLICNLAVSKKKATIYFQ